MQITIVLPSAQILIVIASPQPLFSRTMVPHAIYTP